MTRAAGGVALAVLAGAMVVAWLLAPSRDSASVGGRGTSRTRDSRDGESPRRGDERPRLDGAATSAGASGRAAPATRRREGTFGFVTDGRGAPIEGAIVRLLPVGEGDALAESVTDRDGAFRVGPAPGHGRMRLRVEKDGYAPASVEVSGLGERSDLVLDPGGALRVLVLDAAGEPAAGASVSHVVAAVSTEGTTDAQGRVLFPAVPTGPGTLRASRERASTGRQDVSVGPGESREVVLAFPRSAAIEGVVVSADGARPIGAAAVTVAFPSLAGVDPLPPTLSASDGTFRVEVGVGAGERLEIRTRAEGWEEARQGIEVLAAGDEATRVTVALVPAGWALRGKVLEADGAPAVGAGVAPAWPGLAGGAVAATTDADGRFRLPIPPSTRPGASVPLVASSPTGGIGLGEARPSGPDGQGAPPIVITLSGTGRVAGTVVDEAGGAVRGARVVIGMDPTRSRSVEGHERFSREAVTDEHGDFEVAGVPAGRALLAASHGSSFADVATVDVPFGGLVQASLTLRAGALIEGRVLDERGDPVAGAWITATPLAPRGAAVSVRSMADGTFLLRGVAGEWHLYARAAGHDGGVFGVRAGERDVVLVLVSSGRIEGVVLRGGRAYRGTFAVVAWPKGEGGAGKGPSRSGAPLRRTFRSDDGTFVLRDLDAGTWWVSAETPDGLLASEPRPAHATGGRGTEPVRLVLRPGATVFGTVVGARGRVPLAGARVRLSPESEDAPGGAPAAVPTDGGGRFAVRGLAPGAYRVAIETSAGGGWTERVEVGEAEEREVRWVEPATGEVRFLVTDGEGRALAGALPQVRTAEGGTVWPPPPSPADGGDGRPTTLRTDARGFHLRRDVPPGRYLVTASLPGWEHRGDLPRVDVEPGQVVAVTIVLVPADATASGPR
jgi:hypothetical protein